MISIYTLLKHTRTYTRLKTLHASTKIYVGATVCENRTVTLQGLQLSDRKGDRAPGRTRRGFRASTPDVLLSDLRYVATRFANTMGGRGTASAAARNAILKASVAASAACRNASVGDSAVAFTGCAVKFKTGHEHCEPSQYSHSGMVSCVRLPIYCFMLIFIANLQPNYATAAWEAERAGQCHAPAPPLASTRPCFAYLQPSFS